MAPKLEKEGGSNLLTLDRIFRDPDLGGTIPRALKLSPHGVRATFLRGRQDDANQMDLWEYHIESGQIRLLVDSTKLLAGKDEEVSEEEQARRERERIASMKGIVSYMYSDDGKYLLFPLSGELYAYSVYTGDVKKLTNGEGFATDPNFSPMGRFVSFVRDRNLYVTEIETGKTRQLTTEGGGAIAWGMAEFVAQEEMHRMTGYWWAPDDSYIVAARIDETPVPLVRRFEIHHSHTSIIDQRYPAAGKNNVIVKLGLLDPTGEREMKWLDLGADEDIYLCRVDWTRDAKGVLVQRHSRDQHQLDVLLYDIAGEGTTVQPTTIIRETSETWINLHDDLRVLPDGHILWASEKKGGKHLYIHDANGKEICDLTSGNWAIDNVLAVDTAKGIVYFTANRDSVLDKHLYSVPISGGDVTKITQEPGWHEITFNKGASVYFDTWSDAVTPPQVSLHRADGSKITDLSSNQVTDSHPLFPYRGKLAVPEYGTITAEDGVTPLHYQMFLPVDFDPAKKYPVYLRVYGGPHSQQVQKRWLGRSTLVDNYMAQQGFVVFTLDNRGSARRGKTFEEPLYRHMGNVEVRDQLAGVSYLKSQPWVDADRVGVFGWSYGGYMTLMLLSKAGSEFACGVSVAPVTDWMLYDTYYTERYMHLPKENEEGYKDSSVFAHLSGLQSNKLYLIHGMADDNVLFTNATQLMHDLQRDGKRFRLMTYPGERHGISNPGPRQHVWEEICGYFAEKIGTRK